MDRCVGGRNGVPHETQWSPCGCLWGRSGDKSVNRRFCEIFERDVAVFFVATGTAANSLALSAYAKPGGAVFCHAEAHVQLDECSAPEFFSSGAKLVPLEGARGKFSAETLRQALEKMPEGNVQHGQPAAVTISQASESGTVYLPDEIRALKDIAASRGLPLHMDGARFANALVHLDVTPAEMTWKAGVDVLSFGGTKNGCWCAEAVVFFDKKSADSFGYLRKRGGQLLSKSRFAAAQFEGYFENGHWLDLARHANAMAARLADGVTVSDSARLAWVPQANEVFAILPVERIAALRAAGAVFYEWPAADLEKDEALVRLVTSFQTTAEEVDGFLALI